MSSAWTDNTAGALFQSTGYPVGDGTTIRLFGRSDGPGDGEFDRWWRIELQRADNGRLSQRYCDLTATGEGVLVFETTFTRRK